MFGWKSKGLPEESITTPSTPGNSYAPKLIFVHNWVIAVILEGIKQEKASFTHVNVVNFFIVYELDTWLLYS